MNPTLSPDYVTTALQEACPGTGWKARVARQFGKPGGRMGRLVGFAMSLKNRARSKWVLSLLDLESVDRVIEVGFGSGRDLQRIVAVAREGLVAGVDHSAEMVRMARANSMGAILGGRADIRQAVAENLPFRDEEFTKAFSINSVQFWPDRRAALLELKRVLRPGGLIAIALEPRGAATPELALANGETIAADLTASGFLDVRLESSTFGSVPTMCAIGIKEG
jgi:SAM-dependent methyltransferase